MRMTDMNSVFVVITLFGGIFEDVKVCTNFEAAKKAWEIQTDHPWSEYETYADCVHEKEEVRVYETELLSLVEEGQE